MKEKEFDIAIRNILQDAEEPVSPRVWEGIEAGLDKRRRIPAWVWSVSGVAAAAAIALGVFLFRPAAPEHSNPTILITETPKATVPPVEATPETEEIAPIEEQVARTVSRLAYTEPAVREEIPAAEEPAPAQAEETAAHHASVASVQPENPLDNAVEDTDAFNRLAFAESNRKEQRGFSFTAGGNIQTNRRGEVPSGSIHRSPGMPGGLLAPVVEKGVYNESPEVNFSLPFSVGIGLKYHFNSRWALGTGIRYTNMSRTFIGDYTDLNSDILVLQTDIDNHQHWVGVPVNLYFNVIDQGRWRLHTFVGGAGEFLLDNDYLIHANPKDIHWHQRGNSIQWSAGAGLGVEFRITPVFGLFVDPSVRYYFGTEKQPRSIRTIQPFGMELEAGIRFSFGQQ